MAFADDYGWYPFPKGGCYPLLYLFYKRTESIRQSTDPIFAGRTDSIAWSDASMLKNFIFSNSVTQISFRLRFAKLSEYRLQVPEFRCSYNKQISRPLLLQRWVIYKT